MRNKMIGILLLLIALSLLTLGIIEEQYSTLNSLYEKMASVP
ncbi:MAG: hypothetical protein ACTSU4_13930 [Promethearchaeota archaeon]